MFKDWIASREGGDEDGLLGNLIADEGPYDRATLWRLGSWGFVALVALTVAILLNQSSVSGRAFASTADIARATERIQWVSDTSQAESRRLTAATQTLQNDRDRLYARVTNVEQTLAALQTLVTTPAASNDQQSSTTPDAVSADVTAAKVASTAQDKPQDKAQDKTSTPAVATEAKPVAATAPPKTAQQAADSAAPAPSPQTAAQAASPNQPTNAGQAAPQVATQASTQVASLPLDPVVTGSISKDSARPENSQKAVATSTPSAAEQPGERPVEQTKFGLDLGTASSMQALRVLWATMQKSTGGLLGSLRPIVMMKEGNNGLGLQLHLVAGPLTDAAAATQLCAVLAVRNYPCDTAEFDGQRLSMDNVQAEAEPEHPAAPPVAAAASLPTRIVAKKKKDTRRHVVVVPPPPQQTAPAPSAFARLLGR
jgi:hypothetical protein